jgi:hypothetical protein
LLKARQLGAQLMNPLEPLAHRQLTIPSGAGELSLGLVRWPLKRWLASRFSRFHLKGA